jgi:hypothetical protein
MVEYRSASADALTSPGLRSLSQLLAGISSERARVSAAIGAEARSMTDIRRRAERARGFLSKLFVSGKRRDAVVTAANDCEKQFSELEALLEGLAMDADFDLDAESRERYDALTRAFERMRGSAKIWDVSASRAVDRSRTRASHANEIVRSEVTLRVANLPEVDSDFEALHFQNANGADLYLYPYFLAIPRPSGGFALLDLREIATTAENRTFVEQEEVPHDALIVGYSWERSNKDGSPDKRFAQNRQIPNCYYSELLLRSQSGLHEVYQFSNADVASAFVSALQAFMATLPSSTEGATESDEPLHQGIPRVTLPAMPTVPSLMGVGVIARAAALAVVTIGVASLLTPNGRTQAERMLAQVQGEVAKILPNKGTDSTSADEPELDTSGLIPVAPEVPSPAAAKDKSVAQQEPSVPTVSSSTTETSPAVNIKPTGTTGTSAPVAQSASPTEQPVARPQLSAAQISTLQTRLIALGYQEGEPERTLGARALRAFNQWRAETGKTPVASIGPDEYAAFMRAIDR